MTDVAVVERGIFCEACYLERPVEDFLEMHSADAIDPSPQVCDHCRKFGKPLEDPCGALTPQWRGVVKSIANGVSVRNSAREAGMDEKTIRSMLDGRENADVRAAMRRLTIDAGLGTDAIIKVIGEAMAAERHAWNPEEREFNMFDDHGTRLNAIKPLLKLHALEAPMERANTAAQANVQMIINTNLGSKDPIMVEGAAYRVQGKKAKET